MIAASYSHVALVSVTALACLLVASNLALLTVFSCLYARQARQNASERERMVAALLARSPGEFAGLLNAIDPRPRPVKGAATADEQAASERPIGLH